ncbi:hypothetical protein NBRC111894_2393 [Sporolactobacillus inulinus]|uniref:Uncharacterized protein n=1 Tax=Sporolactobacillus inulinus TaxID=2078 RepID=A0A4Y1ZCT4_9BACL|nr:hypothetical protein NBRC111894_2393 [Sporolactobacillus inulinus]
MRKGKRSKPFASASGLFFTLKETSVSGSVERRVLRLTEH